MPKYRAAMTVFGLNTNDTFESEDPRWEEKAGAGFVVKVSDDTPVTVTEGGEGNLQVPEGVVPLTKEEHDRRVAAGDPTPVKPGEVYSEKIPPSPEAAIAGKAKRTHGSQ